MPGQIGFSGVLVLQFLMNFMRTRIWRVTEYDYGTVMICGRIAILRFKFVNVF